MPDSEPDRKLQWQPPPRPDWVRRINEEGYCMNIRGVVPLDENSLLASARQATGLSDFGADDWYEPFRVLVKAFDEDAELNLMGRIRTRSEVLQLLEARLQVEDTYKRHPEIDDEEIVKPMIIIGGSRSGSSFFQNVLSMNPNNGAIKTWEAIFPCPPPEKATYLTDPRVERGHKLIDQWNRVTPTIASMHEFAGELPMEDCQVLAMNFMSASWFTSLGQAVAYDALMAATDQTPAFRYQKRVMKLLQWKNPRKNWVLKDPVHIDRIEALLTVFPDACMIWPHRDPVRAMASTVSLMGTIQWGRSDHPFKDGSFDVILNPIYAAKRLDDMIDKLEAGSVPKNQLFNVLYRDLVGDTLGTIERMHRFFGIPLSAEGYAGMKKYLDDNPRSARPAHKIAAVKSETEAYERQVFRRYQEYFKVPSE